MQLQNICLLGLVSNIQHLLWKKVQLQKIATGKPLEKVKTSSKEVHYEKKKVKGGSEITVYVNLGVTAVILCNMVLEKPAVMS